MVLSGIQFCDIKHYVSTVALNDTKRFCDLMNLCDLYVLTCKGTKW